jgi:hypothetical protein
MCGDYGNPPLFPNLIELGEKSYLVNLQCHIFILFSDILDFLMIIRPFGTLNPNILEFLNISFRT